MYGALEIRFFCATNTICTILKEFCLQQILNYLIQHKSMTEIIGIHEKVLFTSIPSSLNKNKNTK